MRGGIDTGYYYVEFFIGDNFQKQSLIIDTGSKITAFTCKNCDCGNYKQFNYYDFGTS